MRKVIQISSSQPAEGDQQAVIALCDDGTLWSVWWDEGPGWSDWFALPAIPQGNNDAT